MINILYYNHTAVVSGAEISLLGILNHIDRSRFSVILACPKGELQEKASCLHIPTILLNPFEVGFNTKLASIHFITKLYHTIKELTVIIHDNNIDLIHANSVRAGLLACIAAYFRGIPVIVHVRDCIPFHFIGKITREVIGRCSKKIICNSDYVKKHFAYNVKTLKKSIVIYNAVDLAQFDPQKVDTSELKTELDLWNYYPIIAIIGQITPWKGQIDAIKAMSLVLKTFPTAKLLIVGSVKFKGTGVCYDNMEYDRMLHFTVDSLGLKSNIVFTGERDNIPAVMKSIDLLILPSWEEPFGRVLIEAMAMEKPVIATNKGGPTEIIQNMRTGILIPPKDEHALAKAIIHLCSNNTLKADIEKQGRLTVEKMFSFEQHINQVENIYENIKKTDGE